MTEASVSSPNNLNAIGVLKRREIEVRILAPILESLCAEFGRERVLALVNKQIVQIAHEQGKLLAENAGGDSLLDFSHSLKNWKKDDAMQIEVLEQNQERYAFNVTRCRYAEMYKTLGVPELGSLLSCNRDFALIQGFNPTISLTRTQTIMEGASFCDFRYFLALPGNE
jgi:hypothetical protein